MFRSFGLRRRICLGPQRATNLARSLFERAGNSMNRFTIVTACALLEPRKRSRIARPKCVDVVARIQHFDLEQSFGREGLLTGKPELTPSLSIKIRSDAEEIDLWAVALRTRGFVT